MPAAPAIQRGVFLFVQGQADLDEGGLQVHHEVGLGRHVNGGGSAKSNQSVMDGRIDPTA